KDEVLAGIIDDLKNDKKDIKIVIYSDYPVENKLKSLGIEADYLFTSGDEEIGCMKPDPKGLKVILNKLQISNLEAIMIGDRYEKDGEAAAANDMDYIIVSSDKKERKKQMLQICHIK
ncbi:MAG: HAD family hydrolase, partial [Lachnospiraceae bacterium]|nr:HAD family hydrolase [Lachnospiraceae bacterium]